MNVRATFVLGLMVISATIGSSHGENKLAPSGGPHETSGTSRPANGENKAGTDVAPKVECGRAYGEMLAARDGNGTFVNQDAYLVMKQIKHLKIVGILHETFHCPCIKHLIHAIWDGLKRDYTAAKVRDKATSKQ